MHIKAAAENPMGGGKQLFVNQRVFCPFVAFGHFLNSLFAACSLSCARSLAVLPPHQLKALASSFTFQPGSAKRVSPARFKHHCHLIAQARRLRLNAPASTLSAACSRAAVQPALPVSGMFRPLSTGNIINSHLRRLELGRYRACPGTFQACFLT